MCECSHLTRVAGANTIVAVTLNITPTRSIAYESGRILDQSNMHDFKCKYFRSYNSLNFATKIKDFLAQIVKNLDTIIFK